MAHRPSNIRARSHDCPIDDGKQGNSFHLFVTTPGSGDTMVCVALRNHVGHQILVEDNLELRFPNGDLLRARFEFVPHEVTP